MVTEDMSEKNVPIGERKKVSPKKTRASNRRIHHSAPSYSSEMTHPRRQMNEAQWAASSSICAPPATVPHRQKLPLPSEGGAKYITKECAMH